MQEKQQHILKEALKLVPFDGWTSHTLQTATTNANLDPNYAQIAFPNGVSQLVDFFLRSLDKQMLTKLKKQNLSKLKVRDRIKLAVKTRIELAEKNKNAIRKTITFYSMPYNAFSSIASLWKTVDAIWYATGDKSPDFNHYTKRITLAGVYTSTLLYWLNDKSKDHKDTWSFLSRRIDNVMQFNKFKAKTLETFSKLSPKHNH